MLSVGKFLHDLAKIMALLFLLTPVSGYSKTKKVPMTLVAGPLKKRTFLAASLRGVELTSEGYVPRAALS